MLSTAVVTITAAITFALGALPQPLLDLANTANQFLRSHAAALKIRRYVQTHTLDTDVNAQLASARGTIEAYDGVAELWWESADDLMAAVFPDAAACLENIPGDREIPDHPLVKQAIDDCLHEAMDIDTFLEVLRRLRLRGRR